MPTGLFEEGKFEFFTDLVRAVSSSFIGLWRSDLDCTYPALLSQPVGSFTYNRPGDAGFGRRRGLLNGWVRIRTPQAWVFLSSHTDFPRECLTGFRSAKGRSGRTVGYSRNAGFRDCELAYQYGFLDQA